VIAAVLTAGKPDCQSVDDPELHLEGCVQPGGHDLAPPGHVRSGLALASPRLSSGRGRVRIRHCTVQLASASLTSDTVRRAREASEGHASAVTAGVANGTGRRLGRRAGPMAASGLGWKPPVTGSAAWLFTGTGRRTAADQGAGQGLSRARPTAGSATMGAYHVSAPGI